MENQTVINTLNSPWESKVDVYLSELFLVGSSTQCILLAAAYLAFVLKVGPFFMKDKAPYKLKNVILTYNILQVILSGYIFKLAAEVLWKIGLMSDTCISDSEELTHKYFYGVYIYMLAKISELLDTVFFVLRKKDNQVSVLHVYHHSAVFLYSWAALSFKYIARAVMVLGVLNSFIHLIMYAYYAVSVFPNIAKYVWWKKYITKMQIIQFVLILVYAVFEYYMCQCGFTDVLLGHFVFNLSLVCYLFIDFYRKTYKSKEAKKK